MLKIKPRKLTEYLQFNIEVTQGAFGYSSRFTANDGTDLPYSKSSLTPSQWRKASQYLTRNLVPFAGYTYRVKPGVTAGVYKIR